MDRRGPSHSGPYGQACTSCFKAKCKCVARPDGPGCQRCHRLNKACQPSSSLRRRTILNRQNSNAQIAELAKKLDGLIERLESNHTPDGDPHPREHQSGPSTEALNSGNVDQSLRAIPAPGTEPQDSGDTASDHEENTEPMRWSPGLSGPHTAASTDWNFLTDPEMETLLSRFRSRMLHHFPFTDLPARLTVGQLRRDRPFLLRAIVCVVSPTQKASQSTELKRAVCEALLIEDADRLDLLLGLLTYLSWGWDHSTIMSRLMMQAVSLACEISHRSPQNMAPQMRALFMPDFDADEPLSARNFVETQRAILGCFVLSSVVSAYFGHIDALRWTPQMDEGLAALSTNRDCPTDALFVVQVRLQLLGEKAVHIRHQQHMDQGHMQAPATTTSLPALVSLMTLEGELQEIRASLSIAGTLRHLAHMSATELVINETRHAVNATVPYMISHFSVMTASSTAGSGSAKNTDRSWCLWQCVKAIKACVDALLALQPSEFAGISFLQWAQLVRSVIALDHLTIGIEDPAWDRAAVRAAVDVPTLLNLIIQKLELAAQVVREQEAEGIFTRLACRMREFRINMRGSAAREQRANEDMNAQSRVYGGALGGDLANMPVTNFFA